MYELDAELPLHDYHPFAFPLSQHAWERFGLAAAGADARHAQRSAAAAREVAARLNAHRDFQRPDVLPAKAGEVLAFGLLTEIFRYLISVYATDHNPGALAGGLDYARQRAGDAVAARPLPAFAALYPPHPLRANPPGLAAFLEGRTGAWPHREVAARELLLLYLSVVNPALRAYRDLFDDRALRGRAPYLALIEQYDAWFKTQPPFPGTDLPLLEFLLAPMRANPDSILAQLDFIRRSWAGMLPAALLERLLVARGVLQEERQMRGHGPGPALALDFRAGAAGYEEYEAFSIDREWMPNLVLIAKTVYVWLYQLERQYGCPIHRLDQIPDAELDALARRGITGLWLIGLWERSEASRTIKVMTGNPEAAPSAYSLYDYTIAWDLGGQAAFDALARRAWARGIRLASDMVPNHVGICSKWVIEHPGWFVQLDHPPFPGYTFNGPDLSNDGRVGLYLEDGYWNRTDAAVVFKRVDRYTGHTRYLYHGNDGTSMPWNDTAQLNYLLPEVREAVIQTILHVARMFPIIRFDAAMTLAKRHYQRLWFPLPGDGGAIPTRAERGMTKPDFDHVFPVEFWREVVDRVAAEAPDTLLLAEAFWLMEGYFVRTLGMHRVYNSAFMNMLKMEENAKYRQTLKNVLEFSPEVLQRFVNFMNNPDEQTAEAQFGKGDKYFGVCMMLCTLPGLPMLGHGQIEGYTEKYGMEYRRAYKNETPDEGLVARHEAEIFPLLHRRFIFSGARHFALYDFETEGGVDENVFAYSNRSGHERALVVYNNAYPDARGRIRTSTAINAGPADAPVLKRLSLAEGLALDTADNAYYICRDSRTGLEYLEHAGEVARHGIAFDLHGYAYRVLLDWRLVHDFDHSWGRLHAELRGRGVPSVEEAYHEMHLAPVLEPFRALMTPANLRLMIAPGAEEDRAPLRDALAGFLRAAAARIESPADIDALVEAFEAGLVLLEDPRAALEPLLEYPEAAALADRLVPEAGPAENTLRILAAWIVLRCTGEVARPLTPLENFDPVRTGGAWTREWYLLKPISRAFEAMDGDAWRARQDAAAVRMATAYARLLEELETEVWAPRLVGFFHDRDIRAALGVHRFGGRTWFVKERLDEALDAITLGHALCLRENAAGARADAADALGRALAVAQTLREAAQDCGYDLDATLDVLK